MSKNEGRVFSCFLSALSSPLFLSWFPSSSLRLPENGVRISHSKEGNSLESAQELVRLDGDLTLLSHGWYVRGEPIIKEWLGAGGRKFVNGPFTLLTKQKMLNVQTLVASDGVLISMFEIDTTPALGRPIILWAVDLPSSFRDSKMTIAKRARILIDTQSAPPPDIVIGDFNMTRNMETMSYLNFPQGDQTRAFFRSIRKYFENVSVEKIPKNQKSL